MVLGGPITIDWSREAGTAFVGILLSTVAIALLAAGIGAAGGCSRGSSVALRFATRSFLTVMIIGSVFGVGVWSLLRASSGPSESEAGPTTTAGPPARRYDDHLPFTGDQAEADRIIADVRVALEPLAGTGLDATPAQLEEALAPVTTPEGPLDVVTDTGRVTGPTFTAEAAGGCLVGSVRDGEVSVEIDGYIADGGCVALVGH